MLQQILQTATPKEVTPLSEPSKGQDKTTKSLFAKLMGALNMNTKAERTAPEASGNKQQGTAIAGNHTNAVAKKTLNEPGFQKITELNSEKDISSLAGEEETKGEDISLLPVAVPVTEVATTRVIASPGKTVTVQHKDDADVNRNLKTKTGKIKTQTENSLSESKHTIIKQKKQTGAHKEAIQSLEPKGISKGTESVGKPNTAETVPKTDIKLSEESRTATLTKVTTNRSKVARPGTVTSSPTATMPEPETSGKASLQTAARVETATGEKQFITDAKYQADGVSPVRPGTAKQPASPGAQAANKTPKIMSGAYNIMTSAENPGAGKTTRLKYTPSHKFHAPSPELKQALVLQQIAPPPVFTEGELAAGNSGLNLGGRFSDPGNNLMFPATGLEAASTSVAPTNSRASISGPGSGPWSVAVAMQEIGRAAAQDRFRLKLALEPAHLGKIQVFLESDVNKQIQVHLVLEQTSSRQALEQQLPSLRQALANHGLSLGHFSMSSQQDNGRQKFTQDYNTPTANPASVLMQPSAGTEQISGVSNGHISIHI